MNRFVFIVLSFLLNSAFLSAQSTLQKALDAFADSKPMKHAGVSVSVIDVESGKLLAAVYPHRSLVPASSLKVVTTATALSILGKDFQFKTELQYQGQIEADGTLKGNLIIKGYGDPTLGTDHYNDPPDLQQLMRLFIEAIQKQGIRRIEGRVIADASFFDTAVNGRAWLWEDLGNYYASGAWGLNIHDNRYFIDFQQSPNLNTIPKIVRTEPAIPNLQLINEVRSAAANSGDNAYIYGAPYSYIRFVRGTIPVGKKRFTIKGSIPDPPFFAAHYLSEALATAGIACTEPPTSLFEWEQNGQSLAGSPTTFYTQQSPQLSNIVVETNHKSINLYCESMLKWLAVQQGKGNSTAAGIETVLAHWSELGVDTEGFFLEDGSGLSLRNSVSSYHLARIMQLIARDEALYKTFSPSLPLAGRSGSLKRMLRGTAAEGVLRAKSGGMQRVRSYTGYARSKAGRLLAFSMIANNFTGASSDVRRQMEKLMIAMSQ
ncbi:MAG: D-alanyl-D-alanine carboxypeptidase/D-alanyl-D-alanine-endopeptidase [Bacteroidota bacterium]